MLGVQSDTMTMTQIIKNKASLFWSLVKTRSKKVEIKPVLCTNFFSLSDFTHQRI